MFIIYQKQTISEDFVLFQLLSLENMCQWMAFTCL